jgi:sugar O-acyltransferase (sialic acid O-acetyltransferase NeuD family)
LAKLAIVGAGPQGRVILQAVRAGRAQFEEMAFFDDDVSKEGRVVGGVPILGGVDRLFQMNDEDYSAAVAIGSNEARTRIAQKIRSAGIAMINVVHPAAIVMPDVVVGSGILVCAGAVVVTGTAMGSDVVINTGATVDHDCSIGAGAYVSPGVHTAGAVSIGAGTFIGAGAIIGPGVSIGEWCVVGAGSVVLENIPSHTFAHGTPARSVCEVSQPIPWSRLLGGR